MIVSKIFHAYHQESKKQSGIELRIKLYHMLLKYCFCYQNMRYVKYFKYSTKYSVIQIQPNTEADTN